MLILPHFHHSYSTMIWESTIATKGGSLQWVFEGAGNMWHSTTLVRSQYISSFGSPLSERFEYIDPYACCFRCGI